MGRIPWTAVHEYAVAEGIENEWRFRRLVRELDDAFVAAVSEGAKRAKEGKGPKDTKGPTKQGNPNTEGGQR